MHVSPPTHLTNEYISSTITAAFSASFMKILPLLGKLYVSTNFICFKSIRVGFRVKAVIALADIVKLDFRKGYSPFYFALVITTKNQDEVSLVSFDSTFF